MVTKDMLFPLCLFLTVILEAHRFFYRLQTYLFLFLGFYICKFHIHFLYLNFLFQIVSWIYLMPTNEKPFQEIIKIESYGIVS